MSQRICVCVCVCAKNNGLLCCQTQLLLQLLIVFEGTLSNLFLCVSQAQRDIIIKFVCVCVCVLLVCESVIIILFDMIKMDIHT